jgi:uncharacterized YigZ family protein
MDDVFYTIKSEAKGFFSDKGSKFHAFAYPVNSEVQIKSILQELRKQFHDARHHVYAYMLGADCDNYRANDDGEPSNSSGPPILGQIRSHNITNVLIVVIRYFGGTKLGIHGLINAYKSAAIDALNNAEIIEKFLEEQIEIRFEYSEMAFVQKVIKEYELTVINQDFRESCLILITVRLSDYHKIFDIFQQNHKLEIK